MNGTVIPGTPIAVDFWKIRECPTAKLFFLTHLHGDHTVGLSSSWRHVIHCSPMTGELLTHLYGISESLIRPIEVGTSHILDLDSDNCEKMSVTVIDANHCPGSVMFLFEGYFGRILHTGDFRFRDDMINESNKMLFNNIDLLYLDNTYCSPQCAFPSRDSALDEMVSVINSHPHHSVVIGMRNLGKEDMLAKTALRCKEWISIPATMMQRVNLLNLPNVFVTDDESCRIRVVKFHTISKKNMALWNKVTPTIAILPTALYQGMDFNSFGNMTDVFIVQYSDHSSYRELYHFVSVLKPRKIIPVVGAKARGPFGIDISDRANMKCFSHLLNKSENFRKISNIPETVKIWMYNGSRSCSNEGGDRLSKPWKFKHKKSSSSIARGVVFSENDDNEECKRKDHQSSEKISDTVKNIHRNSNKKRKRNFSEILDSNINSQSLISEEQKVKQKNCQPQGKETLLDKWLSVSEKKEKNQQHHLSRPLCSMTRSRDCSLSKTTPTENNKPITACNNMPSNPLEATYDTSGNTLTMEVEQDAGIEDVIILDDSSSDSTHSPQSKWRGDNSTVDCSSSESTLSPQSHLRGDNSTVDCSYGDDSKDFVTKEQTSQEIQDNKTIETNHQEPGSCECDSDLSIKADCTLPDRTNNIDSHSLYSPKTGMSCTSTGSHVTLVKGYTPDSKFDQVYSCNPKQHVVKPSKQIFELEHKSDARISVKPVVFGRKTIFQRQSSSSRKNNRGVLSVMPLDQGK